VETATFSLKGYGRHAAAIRNPASHDSGTAWSAARLTVKGKERHSLGGHPVEVRRGYAAALAAAINTKVTPSDVIANDEDDVWLAAMSILCL
jgi:hypothetical protein